MKKLALAFLMVLVCAAPASADWAQSKFSLKMSYLDLVTLQKTDSAELSGIAVFDSKIGKGHLLVDGEVYAFGSVVEGTMVMGGLGHHVCFLGSDVLLSILRLKAKKLVSIVPATDAFYNKFVKHITPWKFELPIALDTASASVEEPSDYAIAFTEPEKALGKVYMTFSASGKTDIE